MEKEQRAAMCVRRLFNTHTKGAESKSDSDSDVRGGGSTAFFGERGREKKGEGRREKGAERET
jgi:hypothetical protein